MPIVRIPSLYWDLTNGKDRVELEGSTVGEVVNNWDKMYPGIKKRLFDEDELKANISVIIDGEVSQERLKQKVSAKNEIFFVPAIGGG